MKQPFVCRGTTQSHTKKLARKVKNDDSSENLTMIPAQLETRHRRYVQTQCLPATALAKLPNDMMLDDFIAGLEYFLNPRSNQRRERTVQPDSPA